MEKGTSHRREQGGWHGAGAGPPAPGQGGSVSAVALQKDDGVRGEWGPGFRERPSGREKLGRCPRREI